MAILSDKFTTAMTDAGLTREQQEKVVAALAREPNIIAFATGMAMDRQDFMAGHRA